MRSIQVFIRWQGWAKKYSSGGKDGIRSTVYIWWQGWEEKYSSGGKDKMRSIHLVEWMGWDVFILWQGWDEKYSSSGKDGMRSIYLVARTGWQVCIYKDRLRLFIWCQGWGWQVFIWWYGWDEKDSPCNFPSYPGVWGKPPVPQIIPGGDGGNPRHCFQVA